MARRLPPFAAVRAFEAAARHLSFKAAAAELCLSPSAISHQIRGLEAYLDTRLFEREGNRLALTLTGRAYAGRLTHLLDDFDDSTRAVRDGADTPFRVLSTPGFAARWLVPRLDRLSFANRLRLRVSSGAPSTDFAANDSDVVIQWSDDPVPGVVTEPFLTACRFPVISPALRDAADVRRPEDLLRLRLMHDEVADAWAEWFAAAGVPVPDLPRGPVLPNCELATTAAEQGQGVSLAYEPVVRATLESGRLVQLFDTVTMPIVIYSLACPVARANDPRIAEFRDFLFSERDRDAAAQRLHAPAAE